MPENVSLRISDSLPICQVDIRKRSGVKAREAVILTTAIDVGSICSIRLFVFCWI